MQGPHDDHQPCRVQPCRIRTASLTAGGRDAVRHAVDHDFAGSTAASELPELTGDSFTTHEASGILINDD